MPEAEDESLSSLLNDDAAPEPRSAAPRRAEKRRFRRWLVVLLSVLSVIVIGVGFYVFQALFALTQVSHENLMPTTAGRPPLPEDPGEAPINIVLMGSDSRGADQGRSDTLMVAHITGDRSKVYLVSFPRDMYVAIPGRGDNKINAAYAFGGVPLTIETLESLLDVRMEHAVLTDFPGFIGLTTELGGVTVYNDTDETTGRYHFPRGEITISGDEALAYVRERHQLADGDLGRAARQRAVVKAIALKLMKPSVMANPVTFSKVASQIGQYFTVDAEMSVDKMFALATSLKVKGGDDIIPLQAPITGFGTSPAGASIDIVDTKQLAEMATAMRDDDMASYWEKHKGEQFNPNR